MSAVFRHELSSYFTNLIGYVFGAFLLLFAGIFTMVYNLNYQVANFEYVLSQMSFVFLIAVPILTMRTLAEERRQKTDQLLYSLPLSMTQVVLGKYAASLCVFLPPTLLLCLYPLVLSAFGNLYLPAAFGSIAGFFFLGAALTAIGVFLSSVTESQTVAAGLCFVVMLVNYFLNSLASFVSSSAFASFCALAVVILLLVVILWRMTRVSAFALGAGILLEGVLGAVYLTQGDLLAGLFPEALRKLSLFERFYTFVDGVFDVTAIVYDLTIIGFFLFLSVQSMEKRRWSE